MHTGLSHMHSLLRWILLALMIITLIRLVMVRKSDNSFPEAVRKLGLFTLISAHLQLVIGLTMYIVSSERVKMALSDMGTAMGTTILRFVAVEHITGMIIGIVMITIGYSKSKRAESAIAKNRTMFRFFLIGLIVILASIPWPFREGFEFYGWF